MKTYNISRYPYHHGMFRTNEYFEVYYTDDEDKNARGGVAVALFGNLERAEAYKAMLENEEGS